MVEPDVAAAGASVQGLGHKGFRALGFGAIINIGLRA